MANDMQQRSLPGLEVGKLRFLIGTPTKATRPCIESVQSSAGHPVHTAAIEEKYGLKIESLKIRSVTTMLVYIN